MTSLICIIVIGIVIRFKTLRKKKANQLLLNLCIGHLLAGIPHFCRIFSTPFVGKFVFAGYMYSTTSLVFLSFDRFIFIRHPFRYNTKLYNQAHIGFMLFSPLVYCMHFLDFLMSKLLTKSGKAKLAGSFIFTYFITVTILVFLNVSIYATICKQRRAIERQCKILSIAPTLIEASSTIRSASTSTDFTSINSNSSTSNLPSINPRSFSIDSTSSTINLNPLSTSLASFTPTNQPPTMSTSDSAKYKKTRSRKQEVRSFYLCFGCVITFALLMSPFVTMRILMKFTRAHIPNFAYKIAKVLAASNSLSDLLIFVWFNVELRVKIKRSIRKKIQQQN